MLNLSLTDDHRLLIDSFARFFQDESSMARVRAAEPLGFDPALHRALGAMGALSVRVGDDAGGGGLGIMEAALVCEQAGRQLASSPLPETIVAARLLAEVGGEPGQAWLGPVMAGDKVVTLALRDIGFGRQMIPAGAVANAVLALDGETVVLLTPPANTEAPVNHASQPVAILDLATAGFARTDLASGPDARDAFLAGLEERKLLVAAQLNGLSRRVVELAVEYAAERKAFDRVIGSYQAVAHPLAERRIDVDGSQLLTWWAIQEVAEAAPDAAGAVCMAYWWAARTADENTRRAIHTFGGYGVTMEYDLQLYFRRAKGWPLAMGDPWDELAEAGARLWLDGGQVPLPQTSETGLDFRFGAAADALVAETRAVLERVTTPEWRAQAHYSYDGYDPEVNRRIGEAGLVHPSWPVEWGGRDAHPFAAAAATAIWKDYSVTTQAQIVTHFVGATLMQCASEPLKRAVLPKLGAGLENCSLGYSEPHSGSDIFAAKTRAVWDEAAQEWVINGQKMFTSGAHVTDYIFLVARTDPDAPKHKGVTLFLVPIKTPGVEVHPIHTVGEERTNTTFYTDVRIPDFYRVGEVNGGLKVLSAALVLEHGANYRGGHHDLVDVMVAWARAPGLDGRPRLEDRNTRIRIARSKVHCQVHEMLAKRAIYDGVMHPGPRTGYGPMSKVFGSESFQRDMADMMDLAAPDTLLPGKAGLGAVELSHRRAQVSTILGGSTEVHRSMIAEIALGLPRSR